MSEIKQIDNEEMTKAYTYDNWVTPVVVHYLKPWNLSGKSAKARRQWSSPSQAFQCWASGADSSCGTARVLGVFPGAGSRASDCRGRVGMCGCSVTLRRLASGSSSLVSLVVLFPDSEEASSLCGNLSHRFMKPCPEDRRCELKHFSKMIYFLYCIFLSCIRQGMALLREGAVK